MRRRFTPDEIRQFLEAADRHLVAEATMIIIGGSAAALAYAVTAGTMDLDTFETDTAALTSALANARRDTGLSIPVQRAAVADLPWHYQSRLVRELEHLRRLLVHVPERHDLVLSKLMRCHEGDLQCIEEMHRIHPLDRHTLVDRFVTEMTQVIGHPKRIEGNLLVAIERLFGEPAADDVESELRRRRR
jgi:hypothetical protein